MTTFKCPIEFDEEEYFVPNKTSFFPWEEKCEVHSNQVQALITEIVFYSNKISNISLMLYLLDKITGALSPLRRTIRVCIGVELMHATAKTASENPTNNMETV
ncbi:hypothetical protein KIL84_013128 [Mauremys mutica]|uniref:Uncharacterized protein n=1 Tax=Mauremys mutica TaxID=74926 RepID=A0A9D4ART5_9SAUR|nr:hypothetical protein KIL84_013128 [Mauremys mutica]